MQEKQRVVLYYRPNCPFCRKVLNALAERHLEMEMVDISQDPQAGAKLQRIGGKQQVPCLIFEQAMYESDAIVAWIGKHL